jgi:hypothetical protein
MMPKNAESENIIIETENISKKSGCEDTNQKWKRECPMCNRTVVFKSYQGIWRANKYNSKCVDCNRKFLAKKMRESWPNGENPFLGKKHTNESKEKCIAAAVKSAKYGKDNPFFGKKHDEKTKEFCVSEAKRTAKRGKENPFYGKCHSKEVLEIIKKSQTGRKMPPRTEEYKKKISERFRGQPKTKEHKENLSIAGKNRVIREKNELGILKLGYNKNGCKIIDEYSRFYNTPFIHAENGGEKWLGRYVVDGYSEKINVVIEIDEPHHFLNNVLRERDVMRMNNIKEKYGCKFIRIKYHKDGTYSEYINEVNDTKH